MASNGEKAVVALVVGAALGYAAGILTAPKSGKETREDIKVAADKLKKDAEAKLSLAKEDLSKAIEEASNKARELSGKGRKELDDLLSKGKDVQVKASDVLKAAKNGESEDKDLQKAVAEVKDAKKHLVNYLKRA